MENSKVSVAKVHIEECLVNLGLKGKAVEVHSSLSSFGSVIGGARSVVTALLSVCDTILMPTYSLQNIRPPENDRPQQNGIDYYRLERKRRLKRVIFLIKTLPASWAILDYLLNGLARIPFMQFIETIKKSAITPFDPNSFGCNSLINDNMGIISKTLLCTPGTIRSKHPLISWGANGSNAKYYTVPHPTDDPLLPLRKLYADNGYVLLLGASLSKCTALHLSEEIVGRRPFIRWVLYSDGVIRRVRRNGCIGGAINLESAFERFAKRIKIGLCEAVVYPIQDIVDIGATIIRRSPEITLCSSGKGCEQCIDAAKGGPIE